MDEKVNECFPTRWSLIVFILYVILFTNQAIFVRASQHSSGYSYSTVTVVMLMECIKLLISAVLYLRQNAISKLFKEMKDNVKVLLLYFIPAVLYTLYNNLAFVNLSVFDPTTYYLLLQFRVAVTGVVFQLLFKKQLSKKQWLSLILLTVGCIVKQFHISSISNEESHDTFISIHLSGYLFLILVQVFCSCFAGVYNEYLLKDAGATVHIMIQNIFMYIDCIICNSFVLLLNGQLLSVFSRESMSSVMQPLVITIMLNGAAGGIMTSLFLKALNSVLKTFASAVDLILTAILSWIVFDIPIDIFTAISIAIVSYAVYLYSLNPISNPGKLENPERGQDKVVLVTKDTPV